MNKLNAIEIIAAGIGYVIMILFVLSTLHIGYFRIYYGFTDKVIIERNNVAE